MFITINGKTHYLWRAVDQHGGVLGILVISPRDTKAATRFFRKSLNGLEYVPRVLVTCKLASYGLARRRLMPVVGASLAGVSKQPRRRTPLPKFDGARLDETGSGTPSLASSVASEQASDLADF
jgi:transposase-like protein